MQTAATNVPYSAKRQTLREIRDEHIECLMSTDADITFRDVMILMCKRPEDHETIAKAVGVDLDAPLMPVTAYLEHLANQIQQRIHEDRDRLDTDRTRRVCELWGDYAYNAINERGNVRIAPFAGSDCWGIYVINGPFDPAEREWLPVGPFKTAYEAAAYLAEIVLRDFLYETFGTTCPDLDKAPKPVRTVVGGILKAATEFDYPPEEPGVRNALPHEVAARLLKELHKYRPSFTLPYWAFAERNDGLAVAARRHIAEERRAGRNPFTYPRRNIGKEETPFWRAVRAEERRLAGRGGILHPSGRRFD
ncbi:hypothetical protein [Pseudaminobacter sp. NGMCC 1.201702]|uniref:hypothetical protein n=1 Tax=Pseudaminobacter sp. NGMCC 1.201702 TaxID=3391825 RepID=UPI0039EEDD48